MLSFLPFFFLLAQETIRLFVAAIRTLRARCVLRLWAHQTFRERGRVRRRRPSSVPRPRVRGRGQEGLGRFCILHALLATDSS